jgi:hypothetical protein
VVRPQARDRLGRHCQAGGGARRERGEEEGACLPLPTPLPPHTLTPVAHTHAQLRLAFATTHSHIHLPPLPATLAHTHSHTHFTARTQVIHLSTLHLARPVKCSFNQFQPEVLLLRQLLAAWSRREREGGGMNPESYELKCGLSTYT